MAKDKKDAPDAPQADVAGAVVQEKAADAVPQAEKADSAPQQDATVLVTFDRWFRTLGRPEHHKRGMRAFASTDGKRTVAAWNQLFKNY